MRYLSAALLFLAIAACSSSGSSQPPASSSSPPRESVPAASTATGSTSPGADGTSIHVRDFKLEPGDVTISGSTVALAVTNDGPTVHNVTIRDASGTVLAATKDLTAGQSETISAQIPAGTYTLFCSLPGHESLGIKGSLVIK